MEAHTIQWPKEKKDKRAHTENPLTGRHKPN